MFALAEIYNGEDKSSPFVNCMRNNYRHTRKWAKRTSTNCFRIYDRALYHYPLAIDYYDARYLVHYFSPDGLEPPASLVEEVEIALRNTFNAQEIYWRHRIKREKKQQYEKKANTKDFFTVYEYGLVFQVNLVDYLDTGLFLDHRELRKMVGSLSNDKRVLNLFAYTASFSVHAAKNGARFTKSVDMSNTYLDWAKDNFLLNGLSLKNNELVRADCLKFLEDEKGLYDLIIIDPPTISRSKKMDQMFDVQKDYEWLINRALKLLAGGGAIFFSTNSRKFQFDASLFPGCLIQDITRKIQTVDFQDQKIHMACTIRK